MHLYYTRVLGELFSGSSSAYQPYFFVKHLLPPYAVYYYTLLLLSHFVSLLTADRLIICGYFISFVFGFRYAARAIGPNAHVTSLLASLLLLNWTLGMGFANYCLSLSFALWAIGVWLRLGSEPELGRRGLFVALLMLITLSHPVPLLIVLAFGSLDLVCRFVAGNMGEQSVSAKRFLPGALTLVCGSVCLLYVKAFTVAHPLQQRTVLQTTFVGSVIRRAKDILITKNVEVLYGRWWEIELYRFCTGFILLTGVTFAVLQWRKDRGARIWKAGDTMLVFAVILLFALLLLPSDLSGAYFFNERLHILLWISFLLAGSAWTPTTELQRIAAMAPDVTEQRRTKVARQANLAETCAVCFTVAVTVLLLHVANRTLRPFAERDYLLAHTDLPLKGQMAVVLDGGPDRKYSFAGPAWDPYFWDTVALLRHNDGIMENAPWLDSPIIPLAPTETMPGVGLSPKLANSPIFLADALGNSAALRNMLVQKAGVALFSPVPEQGSAAVPALLGDGWACKSPQGQGYRLCTKTAAQTQAELLRGTPVAER